MICSGLISNKSSIQTITFFILYFEKDCPKTVLSGALANTEYQEKSYNTRNGNFSNVGLSGTLKADTDGKINIPGYPSDNDWGDVIVAETRMSCSCGK